MSPKHRTDKLVKGVDKTTKQIVGSFGLGYKYKGSKEVNNERK